MSCICGMVDCVCDWLILCKMSECLLYCSNVIISFDFRGAMLLLCMSECGLWYPEIHGTSMGCVTELTFGVEPAFHCSIITKWKCAKEGYTPIK